MFVPTLEKQGTKEQKEKWVPLAKAFKMIGTYAQTELGHGNDFLEDYYAPAKQGAFQSRVYSGHTLCLFFGLSTCLSVSSFDYLIPLCTFYVYRSECLLGFPI